MSELHYTVAADIFQRFPGYVRGVVIGHEVRNGPSPEALVQMLRDAEASVRGRLGLERLAEEPRIKAWREAYRAFGARPSEFRSSIEALARRALRSEPIPSINALVDLGSVASLRHLIPVGGTPSTCSGATSRSAWRAGARSSRRSGRTRWSTPPR